MRFRGDFSKPGRGFGAGYGWLWNAPADTVPFRTATLANGRFSARYRFTSTMSTQRYSFRAAVRKDPSFPYAAATSPPVTVLVRP